MTAHDNTHYDNPWLAIPKQPQRQDSTQEQLNDLRLVAIHLGMYDALDHLQKLDLAMRLDLKPGGVGDAA